ncbi:Uncharacterised protein [Streptococcus pneumoniae]|nr:Uncharacterised protein [Streptococcus pneumoniae]
MPTQISVSVLFLTTRRTDEHEGKIVSVQPEPSGQNLTN